MVAVVGPRGAKHNVIGPTAEAVLAECAEHFGVSVTDMSSADRSARVAEARHLGMYVAKVILHRSVDEIATTFRRNPSAVFHGVQRARTRIQEQPSAAADLRELCARLDVDADLTGAAGQSESDVSVHSGIAELEPFYESFAYAKSLDLSYNTAKWLVEEHLDRIATAIRGHGCRVRFVLTDPQSEFLQNRGLSQSLCPGSNLVEQLEQVVKALKTLRDELDAEGVTHGSLGVRYRKSFPTASIAIVNDSVARITPYLAHISSLYAPAFDVGRAPAGIFASFRLAFYQVWAEDGGRGVFFRDFAGGEDAAVEGNFNPHQPVSDTALLSRDASTVRFGG